MSDKNCCDCGTEYADNYTECCGLWLCDRCMDTHDNKYPFPVKDFDVEGASITKEQVKEAVRKVKIKK